MFQQRSVMAPVAGPFDAFRPDPAGASLPAALRVGDALAILRQRWRIVVGVTLLALVVAGLAALLVPARYTAVAQILIQPTDLRVLDNAVTQRNGTTDASVAQVESQAQVISSNNVLQRVVEGLDLKNDPEFGAGSPGLRARMSRWLQIHDEAAKPDEARVSLELLARRLSVRRSERSFVVDVAVTSLDPAKAARLTNAVVASYLTEQVAARSDAARRATTSLEGRLGELKERVRVAEERAAAFKAQNRLVGAGGRLVTDQQIAGVTANLLAARSRTGEARSRYEQIQNLRRGADPGAIAEALQSPGVTAMRVQYAEISRAQAEAGAKLGPRHPQVVDLESQLRSARLQIDEEVGRVRQAARGEYERAQANETALARSLDALTHGETATEGALVRLRELDREVEASRAVYQAYLTRSRETSEQDTLDTSNARVISQAQPPLERSSPPRTVLILAVGLLVGLGAGIGLAGLRNATDRRVLTRERLQALSDRPTLAVVKRPGRLWRATDRERLRRALEFGARQVWAALSDRAAAGSQRTILLVGADPGIDPEEAGHALAEAAARTGARPLLLDLTRSPKRSTPNALVECARDTGLSTFVVRDPDTGVSRLPARDLARLYPAGPNGSALARLLREARAYDTVVVLAGETTVPLATGADWAGEIVAVVGSDARDDDVRTLLASLEATDKLRGTLFVQRVGWA